VLAEQRQHDQAVPARYALDASARIDTLERAPEGQALSTVVCDTGDDEPELWTVEHFHLEVAKVLRRDTLTGVLDDQRATRLTDVLTDWPLTVVSVAPVLVEAWQLRNNLTVHDALYVVATRRLDGATLVTTDRKLIDAPGVDLPVIPRPPRLSRPLPADEAAHGAPQRPGS
jgi:predicted nucleic acid-binding protein